MSDIIRPRRWTSFSLRKFVAFVTLACCYAACWRPTTTWGTRDVEAHVDAAAERATRVLGVAPLLVAVDRNLETHDLHDGRWFEMWVERRRSYYFWCFGFVAKLPYERTMDFGTPAETSDVEIIEMLPPVE